jgi:N6-adenosine-specific RNA methylase IME4
VPSLLAADAVVWLWTTNAFLEQAYPVARAWGLEVRTILTWAKDRVGTSAWLRGQTEPCLLCTRGEPALTLTTQSTLLLGRARQHSRKPEEFFTLVDSLCPGRKLELFARERRAGWEAWGAEPDRFQAASAESDAHAEAA